MPVVMLSDGAQHECAEGSTAAMIAAAVAPHAVACRIDDVVADLSEVVAGGARLQFIRRDDEAILPLIRHDCVNVNKIRRNNDESKK